LLKLRKVIWLISEKPEFKAWTIVNFLFGGN